jgi:hypothetical protein
MNDGICTRFKPCVQNKEQIRDEKMLQALDELLDGAG